MPDSSVDYVVVGAGTAGCVLAARLAVDPHITVALLELGGMDTNPAIYAEGLGPMFSLWDPRGAENWGYATTPQAGLGGRTIDVARGKVLGGSSAVNAMIYIRGNRRDFDGWAKLGNRGWSYDEVLPYFKKSETFHGPLSPYHGDNGPLSVIDMQTPSTASHAFVEAAALLGADQKYNDFNGASQEAGAGFYQSTHSIDAVRVTAGSAFVRPILAQNNFRLLINVRATRIVVEQGRARGITYTGADGVATLRAEREVILCAGAYETPKLMMLSGLGPAAQVAPLGIPVVRNLPGVGADLQDHLLLGVGYECRTPQDPPELLAEAGLFTWSGVGPRDASPDLQYFFGPIPFGYSTDNPSFTFAPILAQPRSRGTVTLASADPTVNARVDPQYLSRDDDLAVLENGIRYARELVRTAAFKDLVGNELAPGANVTGGVDLRDYIRRVASTVWHPVGTCKMGPESDAAAVVDDRLRVRGVEGLRIADASVMPKLVNGNPNAAIMMIAERAADLIRGEQPAAAVVPPAPELATTERP
ncbi:MAG: GMC family oxidoreductase [Rhodoplanes sp.]